MDMVPGLVSSFWMTPTNTGEYDILCAELCGVGHYNMRSKVIVENAEDFQQWLSQQTTFSHSLSGGTETGLVEQGRQLSESRGCFACHSVDGSKSLAPTWKNLFGKVEKLTDGTSVTVDEDYLRESIVDPNAKMVAGYPPVMIAYAFSDEQLDAIIAYTKSLTDTAETNTDSDKGTPKEP